MGYTPRFSKERIVIVTEAVDPQINGVVRTYQATLHELKRMGHAVLEFGPDISRIMTFDTSEPHIYLEFFAQERLKKAIVRFKPTRLHIATEGPLGWTARKLFTQMGRPFTTAYHTRWPEYARDRVPTQIGKYKIPDFRQSAFNLSYSYLRRFHKPSAGIMVTTQSMKETLEAKGFRNIKLWSHGVDTGLFKPASKSIEAYEGLPRPILLYFGRVVAEKNLEDFFELETTGSKVVIGEGGDLKAFIDKYPDVHFLGSKTGEDLVNHCAAADLFVFPSLTDTFGLALLEAAAMGLRVAAYPVQGPVNIFSSEECDSFAVLNEDLQTAVDAALKLPDDPEIPRAFVSSRYTWAECTRQFLSNLRTSTDS